MPTVLTQVEALLQNQRIPNPKLVQAILLISQQLHNLTVEVEGLQQESEAPSAAPGTTEDVEAPVVAYIFTGTTLRLYWSRVDGAFNYEVRKGTSWGSATFQFKTSNLRADLDPIATGTHTYLIKSVDITGLYSADTQTIVVSVPPIDAVIALTQVIDNNVLLSWETPVSAFNIDYYILERDGEEVGRIKSNFQSFFEPVSATYTYSITAVDLFGNQSAEANFDVVVNQPPDYVLEDLFVSLLNGTKSNVLTTLSESLVGPVEGDTWANHFINNSWSTIQDQIDDGFPIYCTPSKTTGTPNGYYEEIKDYVTTFTSGIVTVTFTYNQFDLVDPVSLTIKMATSTDGISYSAFTSGASQYLTNFRYVKFKFELTAPERTSLIEIFDLQFRVDVKRENDGGEIAAVSTDVGGTAVTFNKTFKDIDTIVATVKGTTSVKAVVDFVDIPNPTGFKVYAFNDAGTRVSATVEWAARGIV